MRRFEERMDIGDGSFTEWEPVSKPAPCPDKDALKIVRAYNKRAKAEGSYLRIRSVEIDDIFS